MMENLRLKWIADISSTVATTEGIIATYTAELEKFEFLTGDMLASGKKIDETMKVGIAFLSEEIDVLNKWSNNVDTMSKNIDSYPQEYLKKIKSIRTVFFNALNDLQTTASEFLNRGELFESSSNTINNPEDQDQMTTTQFSNFWYAVKGHEAEDADEKLKKVFFF